MVKSLFWTTVNKPFVQTQIKVLDARFAVCFKPLFKTVNVFDSFLLNLQQTLPLQLRSLFFEQSTLVYTQGQHAIVIFTNVKGAHYNFVACLLTFVYIWSVNDISGPKPLLSAKLDTMLSVNGISRWYWSVWVGYVT